LADVALGARCVGCGLPGWGPCQACLECLCSQVHLREVPTGQRPLLGVHSATFYAPPVPGLLKTFKDHGGWGLASPLAAALDEALPVPICDVTLVPVPSPPSVVRRRGFDHTTTLARQLARRRGLRVEPMVHTVAGGRDQQGLGRRERFINRSHRFVTRPAATPTRVVIVDDLVTTGATLLAMVECLTVAGHEVVGAVTVADAQLRGASHRPKGGNPDSGHGVG